MCEVLKITRNNHAKPIVPYSNIDIKGAVAPIDIDLILSENFVVVVPHVKKIGPKADFLNPCAYS